MPTLRRAMVSEFGLVRSEAHFCVPLSALTDAGTAIRTLAFVAVGVSMPAAVEHFVVEGIGLYAADLFSFRTRVPPPNPVGLIHVILVMGDVNFAIVDAAHRACL